VENAPGKLESIAAQQMNGLQLVRGDDRADVRSGVDSVEKVASLKWLQICQITNDIFD
jgi:hypothetical protein